tara:strand:- start:981 stop:1238 length:258 start_codon:yes stop_codon:yes gene_type:complete
MSGNRKRKEEEPIVNMDASLLPQQDSANRETASRREPGCGEDVISSEQVLKMRPDGDMVLGTASGTTTIEYICLSYLLLSRKIDF